MPQFPPLERSDVRLIEQAEANYFGRFLSLADEPAQESLGIRTATVGDGIVTVMTHDTSGYWSKAIGFGFDVPVSNDLIAEVLTFFRKAGKQSALLAIAPHVLPPDWETICRTNGITKASTWGKFACETESFKGGQSEVPIKALVPSDAPAWAHVIREAFGMKDPDLTPLLEATLHDPIAKVLGAWDGDLLVGVGAVHVFGEVASLNTGGTLPSHRNRGVQSGLLAARGAVARSAGCRLLAAETGNSAEGNASYRNLVRAGFVHFYDRVNWRWSDGPETL